MEYKTNLPYAHLIYDGFKDLDTNKLERAQRVYVILEVEYSNKLTYFQTIAQFVPKFTLTFDDFMDDNFTDSPGDYNEENDTYYTEEGFYEWNISSDVNWKISEKVVMWKPLIDLKKH